MLPVTQANCCGEWPDVVQVKNVVINKVVKPVGLGVINALAFIPLVVVGVPIVLLFEFTRKISAKKTTSLAPNAPLGAANAPLGATNPLLLPEVTIGVLSYLSQEKQMQARTVCKIWDSTFIKLNADDIDNSRPYYFITREARKAYDFVMKKNCNRRCFRVLCPAIKESIKEALKVGLIFAGMYFVGGKVSQNYTYRINEINSYSQGILQMMLEKFNASSYYETLDDCLVISRPRLPSEMLKTTADLVQMLLGEAMGNKILGLGVVIIVGSACAFPHVKKIIKIMQKANLDFKRDFERMTLLEEMEYKCTFIHKMGLFPALDRYEHFTKRKTGFWALVERLKISVDFYF